MRRGTPRTVSDSKHIEGCAYHEAGHAVMNLLCGRKVCEVTLAAGGGNAGWCRPAPPPNKIVRQLLRGTCPRHYGELLILGHLAGNAAENLFHGTHGVAIGASTDYERAYEVAMSIEPSLGLAASQAQAKAYVAWLWESAYEALKVPARWRLVEAVAAALLDRRTLDQEEIDTVVEATGGFEPGLRIRRACETLVIREQGF